MFSRAGVGKSLLATQIAEYLTRARFRMQPFRVVEGLRFFVSDVEPSLCSMHL